MPHLQVPSQPCKLTPVNILAQELLGHASVKTTQIYTQVSIRKLQQVHAETHPGARLKPRGL